MDQDEDDKLNELRDILTGTRSAEVIPLKPRTLAAARDGLPDALRPHFDALTADWHATAYLGGGRATLPDYHPLAELVRNGWRKRVAE
jgi:hypothetical protein